MSPLLIRILKNLFALFIPLIVMIGSVQLLAADLYLAFEYGKASFPPDLFGYTQQERLTLASANILYVRNNLPDETLSSQTLDGAAVYTEREVRHMADVQLVFQSVVRVWQAALILLLMLGFILWRNGERVALASAIQSGGVLTVILIGSIALLALFAWQVWFDNFHLLFFKPGSWLFSYSDTLIRLFPLQFWLDATSMIITFSLIGGLLVTFIGWRSRLALERKPT